MNDQQHSTDDETPHQQSVGDQRPGTGRMPRRRLAVVSIAVASALVLGGGSAAAGIFVTASVARSIVSSASDSAARQNASTRTLDPRFGSFGGGQTPSTGTGTPSTTATASSAEEQVGVVTILTTLGYDDAAQAAGTGMVMTSDGLVLTNNHVIDGSTSIEVTVESTGRTYTATVVGTDATDDVAVLQLADAAGLSTVSFDDPDDATAVGDAVYSVGNAEGTGDLVTAAGSVIAVDQSITVGNEYTGAGESLSGLIEVDSDVVSGDSGGPLFDDEGDVIGIITAASSGSADIVGYAIDVDAALAIVDQIESGIETATVQIGSSPFLGVQLATGSSTAVGVPIAGVIAGQPAAAAGLTGGDTITAVDGMAVVSSDALSAVIAGHEVGDQVVVGWTDAAGAAHSATVTLAAGPA